MAAMDILATTENHKSSQSGICLDVEYPAALETKPTIAVTAKWNPVKVVAEMA